MVKALELIGYGLHSEEFETFATGWNSKAKSDAISLLGSICKFEFIVSFLTAYQFLSHLSGITVKLQSGTAGIMDAFMSIEEIKNVYAEIRTNVNAHFNKIFLQAKRMGDAVQVEPTKCRVSGYQKHRSNASTESVEDHYRVNVAVPFLDHITVQLDQRFSNLSNTATSLLGLIPSIIIDRELDLQAAIELYYRDLPSPELIPQELLRWKMKWKSFPRDKVPTSCAETLHKIDPELYPNIFILLKLAATLPVTSCECERSASSLRRLHSFMRACMTEERMTALGLIHIHYDMHIDKEKVIDMFISQNSRRMELDSLLISTK